MLPGGTDPFYRSILAAGHELYARIEVWSGTGVHLDTMVPYLKQSTWLAEGSTSEGLVYLDGAVSATLGSRVARNLTLTVPEYMYPADVTDLLAPFGNEIRAFYGIRLGDGSLKYTWPVFRGRIRDVALSSDGTCTVQCADRAADVADVNFISPVNSDPGVTIDQQWTELIIDAIPNATFGPSDVFVKLVEPLTWEFDRASALDEMAKSVGAVWYPLANGDFVIRRYPWTVPMTPVVDWDDGPGGTVNGWTATRSRDSIYNLVTVTGERLNGDTPVYATVSDTTPGSPTNVTGNFGVRSLVERLQSPATGGGALTAATALLQTYISPVEEWTLSTVPDGALELGDTGRVLVGNRNTIQVVTAFTLPLGLTGDMTTSTRSLVIGEA